MATVNYFVKDGSFVDAMRECLRISQYSLGLLLGRAVEDLVGENKDFQQVKRELKVAKNAETKDNKEITENIDPIRVKLMCSWTSSEELCKKWEKMSKGGGRWGSIQAVSEEPCDYYVVVNKPIYNEPSPPKEKTILFRMEPHMDKHPEHWGEWSDPKREDFLFAGFHDTHYNNNEWHLSLTYHQLSNMTIEKDSDLPMSTVVSDKYGDAGHILRIDFLKYLEEKGLNMHVYGGNKFNWTNYRGSPPYGEKESALLKYKYTFNCENNSVNNYYTEKLIDAILCECLCFYYGCPNIKEHVDSNSYVYLELENFETAYQTIVKAIEEDWWSQRIDAIRKEKERILNERQFFPRLEKIIQDHASNRKFMQSDTESEDQT